MLEAIFGTILIIFASVLGLFLLIISPIIILVLGPFYIVLDIVEIIENKRKRRRR